MALEDILAISGKPGLYKLKTQTRGGFVAESLIDGKKVSVNIQSNVSILSDIAVYTLTEEVPLRKVLAAIKDKENGQVTSVSHKDNKDKLEEYFFNILPDYDEDRVYASDIKKILQWYNILHKHDLLDFEDSKNKQNSDEEE